MPRQSFPKRRIDPVAHEDEALPDGRLFERRGGRLVRYDLATGKTEEIKLPGLGTVSCSCPDFRTDRCLVDLTSWTAPVTIYDMDAEKKTFTKSIFNSDVVYPGFENLCRKRSRCPATTGR